MGQGVGRSRQTIRRRDHGREEAGDPVEAEALGRGIARTRLRGLRRPRPRTGFLDRNAGDHPRSPDGARPHFRHRVHGAGGRSLGAADSHASPRRSEPARADASLRASALARLRQNDACRRRLGSRPHRLGREGAGVAHRRHDRHGQRRRAGAGTPLPHRRSRFGSGEVAREDEGPSPGRGGQPRRGEREVAAAVRRMAGRRVRQERGGPEVSAEGGRIALSPRPAGGRDGTGDEERPGRVRRAGRHAARGDGKGPAGTGHRRARNARRFAGRGRVSRPHRVRPDRHGLGRRFVRGGRGLLQPRLR